MISAGNDIVALNAVDIQRTQLPAFYSKFITPKELALHNPDEITLVNFIWMLWSAKESAYKYLKRINPELIFAPAKITMQKLNIIGQLKTDEDAHNYYKGEIRKDDTVLPFLSSITTEFIATIIDQDDVRWSVKQIDASDHESQSQAVRAFLLNDLMMPGASVENHPVGYPVLIKDGKELDIAISFAHHDRYVSYSFHVPK